MPEEPAARYLPVMRTPRIYVDTSVIGGCFDPEFALWSNGLFKDFRLGIYAPVLSAIVTAEIQPAPEPIRGKYAELVELGAEILQPDAAAEQLARVYMDRKIVPPKYSDDALHIALATTADVDLLVSWNFKHIVHYDKIRLFNAVNMELGYKALQIYSPREVTHYEEEAV
ncbi:MAG TPA: type II toxin-antitoxin system VapC family toxin [Longimicrobium sp.]